MLSAADRPTLARLLHPVAWWVWAVGLAAAASRTTNPFLLLLVIAVAAWTVLERREIGGSNAFAVFLAIGLLAIVLRVLRLRRRATRIRTRARSRPACPSPGRPATGG